ncbi:MAG: hypothetical protein FWF59_01100 [Turicibacter sp.]|nr:hypothetical protein [Turicibacter sp.]
MKRTIKEKKVSVTFFLIIMAMISFLFHCREKYQTINEKKINFADELFFLERISTHNWSIDSEPWENEFKSWFPTTSLNVEDELTIEKKKYIMELLLSIRVEFNPFRCLFLCNSIVSREKIKVKEPRHIEFLFATAEQSERQVVQFSFIQHYDIGRILRQTNGFEQLESFRIHPDDVDKITMIYFLISPEE